MIVFARGIRVIILSLLLVKPLAISSHYNSSDHDVKKCEALGLCSLGHVKPFLGDIYNSEWHGGMKLW